MKCKNCKWYVPDAPPEIVTKVKNMGDGRGKYVERKVYKRCGKFHKSRGYMWSCNGNHNECFEQKEDE